MKCEICKEVIEREEGAGPENFTICNDCFYYLKERFEHRILYSDILELLFEIGKLKEN